MTASLINLREIEIIEGQINKNPLFEGDSGVLYHFGLGKGVDSHTHTQPVSAWLQVVSGKVQITIDGQSHVVNPGCIIHMPKGIPHSFLSIEDSVVLVAKFTNA